MLNLYQELVEYQGIVLFQYLENFLSRVKLSLKPYRQGFQLEFDSPRKNSNFWKWFKKDKSQRRILAEILTEHIMRTDDERQVAQGQGVPSRKGI